MRSDEAEFRVNSHQTDLNGLATLLTHRSQKGCLRRNHQNRRHPMQSFCRPRPARSLFSRALLPVSLSPAPSRLGLVSLLALRFQSSKSSKPTKSAELKSVKYPPSLPERVLPLPPSWWFPKMAPEDVSKYLQQSHDRVFDNNRAWAADKQQQDPEFFAKLAAGQEPEYLWIGCSDSRIPAEQITGLQPGEAFIHRNIANLVCNVDVNAMAVIDYAVTHLGVKHIVVCGHYGCGGVKAAMTAKDLGILNSWLRNIRDVYRLHEAELDSVADEAARYNRLVELNVIEQCRNIIKTAVVQKSYAARGFPIVHGWVFDFHTGLLKDLKIDFEAMLRDIQKIYNLTED